MRQKRDRLRLRVAALPGVEQAVAGDDLALGGGMEGRETLLDVRLQGPQRLGVLIRIVKTRNGPEADGLAQPRCRALAVDRRARHGGDLKLPRAVGDHVESEHGGDHDDGRDREQQQVTDDLYQPAHGISPISPSWPGEALRRTASLPLAMSAIHVFLAACFKDVDARHKAGHEEIG